VAFLEQKVKLYQAVLNSLDTQQTAERAKIVARLMMALEGSAASGLIKPVDEADAAEAGEEELNFLRIAAGLDAPMQESGQNFGVRYQVLRGIAEGRPEAVQVLPVDRQERFAERLKHLQFMAEQQTVNAQAGRVGVKAGQA